MAGGLGEMPMRMNFYRDTARGKIAGVCAGLSDRMGIRRKWVRIGFVGFAVVTHGIGIALYLLLAIVMPRRDEAVVYATPGAGYGGATMPGGPLPGGPVPGGPLPAAPPVGVRVAEVRTRFTALEARLSRIEAVVTSNELSLRRKFRDLGSD